MVSDVCCSSVSTQRSVLMQISMAHYMQNEILSLSQQQSVHNLHTRCWPLVLNTIVNIDGSYPLSLWRTQVSEQWGLCFSETSQHLHTEQVVLCGCADMHHLYMTPDDPLTRTNRLNGLLGDDFSEWWWPSDFSLTSLQGWFLSWWIMTLNLGQISEEEEERWCGSHCYEHVSMIMFILSYSSENTYYT